MGYAKMLKELFQGVTLNVEDLLYLEFFQIGYLPDRVPRKEFSTLLREYPTIKRFLISRHPPIESFINTIFKENEKIKDKGLINEHCDELLWEIADLIVYNKHPEIYDDKVKFRWDISEIISIELLKEKVVADVGSGSGMLAFLLAKYAKTVYAIEPITSFRRFIREKANEENCSNIYVMDGFLDTIPLPENSLDILFTSNAIGWNPEKELQEVERVVKPNGQAIHIMRISENETENPFHKRLISSDWKYNYYKYQ
ncbi:MAG: class I SAM-dependent methyltransferase, partial [bacterium]|nr:class I SAM-dependent methyltransferase [bacterium]